MLLPITAILPAIPDVPAQRPLPMVRNLRFAGYRWEGRHPARPSFFDEPAKAGRQDAAPL